MGTCKSLLCFLVLGCLTGCESHEQVEPAPVVIPDRYTIDNVKASITKYADGKNAAIALTFDDGTQDQYKNAVPELEKRGLTATFFINGWRIRETPSPNSSALSIPDLRDMVSRGFEVSNHTFNHVNLTTISLDSAYVEIHKNDSVIESWTGVRPATFAFPNNARNKKLIALAQEGRVAARTYEEGFGQTYRTSRYDDMVKWTEKVIKNQSFGVAMYHGITSGYDYWKTPEELMRFFDYLVECRDRLWIATFRDISAYCEERDNTELNLSMIHDTLEIQSSTSLDSTLFNYPLSLIITLKDSISKTTTIIPGQTKKIPLIPE